LIENFNTILVECQSNEDPTINPREIYDIDARAETLVTAGETLFKMIADMRHAAILNEFPVMNKEVSYSTAKYKKVSHNSRRELHTMKYEIEDILTELEKEYYSSRYKTGPKGKMQNRHNHE